MSTRNVDLDKFRLPSFIEKLIAIGEMEVHEEAVSLADLSATIESSSKAKYFKCVGAEQYEMVSAVSGSRARAPPPRRPLPLRHRRAKRDPRIHAANERSAAGGRGALLRRARPSGGAQGRRHRPDQAAVPSAARARRRALYLVRDRLHRRSRA